MLQRIQERRDDLLIAAAWSMGVSAFVGLVVALLAGVPVTGKAPPTSEVFLRSLGVMLNTAAVVFWFLFPPLVLVELFRPKDPTR